MKSWNGTGVAATVAGMLNNSIDATIDGINDAIKSGTSIPKDKSSIESVARTISEKNYNNCITGKW
ncbi:MAG: hypothetical protein WCO11_08050 [Sphingomonadales bacterium]